MWDVRAVSAPIACVLVATVLDGMCVKSADLGRSGREHERGRRREKSVQALQGQSDPVFNVLGATGSPRAFKPW